jgi:hypothetical protein
MRRSRPSDERDCCAPSRRPTDICETYEGLWRNRHMYGEFLADRHLLSCLW